jgi:transketolase
MKIATRDGFGIGLAEAGINPNVIVLGADLSKATKTDGFAKKFPERFFECGIAEANMIGVASGLAANGFKVFISSFASFLTGRYDIIRCSLSYSKAPVVIVGSHGGMAIGKDGVTQMGLEDVSIMRSLPGMTIYNPSTSAEAEFITKHLCYSHLDNPVYLRIGRQPVSNVTESNFENWTGNEVIKSAKNENVSIYTTGCTRELALDVAEVLNCSVVDVTCLKPFSGLKVVTKNIITIEDHSVIGGLGSIISEHIAESGFNVKVQRFGLQDVFPESGDPDDLYFKYGLSVENIVGTFNKNATVL